MGFRQWKKDYDERRRRHFVEDSNQYVTCRQFKFWRLMVLIGYAILALAAVGNSYVDRGRAEDGRAAIVQSGRFVATDGCNRDFRTIEKIRALFRRAQIGLDEQLAAGQITRERHARGIAFYTAELERYRLPDCREARNVITDDPFARIQPPPIPLYPGGPGTIPPPEREGG